MKLMSKTVIMVTYLYLLFNRFLLTILVRILYTKYHVKIFADFNRTNNVIWMLFSPFQSFMSQIYLRKMRTSMPGLLVKL